MLSRSRRTHAIIRSRKPGALNLHLSLILQKFTTSTHQVGSASNRYGIEMDGSQVAVVCKSGDKLLTPQHHLSSEAMTLGKTRKYASATRSIPSQKKKKRSMMQNVSSTSSSLSCGVHQPPSTATYTHGDTRRSALTRTAATSNARDNKDVLGPAASMQRGAIPRRKR